MSQPFAKLPAWADYGLLPLINLVVAFLVAGLVVLLVGESPIDAAILMVKGAFGSGDGVGYTLYYATNFIFTGLCVAIAFHCGLFNIGGEGQAYIGGLGAALVGLSLGDVLPWWLAFPLAIAASAIAGALWALIPAWLQAKRGSHVVITTIMFNFIAASIMVSIVVNFLRPANVQAPETRVFGEGGQLPGLGWLLNGIGLDMRSAPLNISFLLALLAAFLVWVLIWRTKLGYEIRTMGFSPKAARYAGIGEMRIIIIAMLISGALAGMMALNPVMGAQHRLQLDFVAGAGFVGIAVALMGRSHPFGIVLAAILFGMLYQGGAEIAFDMPNISRDMIVIIQGLVILFAGALEHMFRPTLQRIFHAFGPKATPIQPNAAAPGRQ
ncbi:ABC transporter permease [Phyllobacterium sp. 21LDTY02-6]|uniref:ABC transporter permease n=1 Tax=unclassified Phyllobacterium TaxID=2638441 RepID=UPI002020B169|nr:MULTISPECIES: ABC transporter permease [unclassified Phyllobacterium]MCO4317094.1 ABC transporter permease [Phyllobacterium sp. 21LDTY02-6]MCX8278658.1 ABC transporter permease [Phyllobacterium sp. 0TCS1.6C]MCX8293512.1 ABC transporter permease [Phyllobacterium sp. 0TCS1.6A]